MGQKTINLARDFSRFPGGRFRTDGPFSGEQFREDCLVPALAQHTTVIVELDDVAGLPSSFAEEAFGGLVRVHSLAPRELLDRLKLVAKSPRMRAYPEMIRGYIKKAPTAAA